MRILFSNVGISRTRSHRTEAEVMILTYHLQRPICNFWSGGERGKRDTERRRNRGKEKNQGHEKKEVEEGSKRMGTLKEEGVKERHKKGEKGRERGGNRGTNKGDRRRGYGHKERGRRRECTRRGGG
jgi:hypothetical protein